MNIFSFPTARDTPDSRLHGEARDWLVLLTSGQATVADAKALRQWCAQSPEHAQAFEQAKRLWQQLTPALTEAQAPGTLAGGRSSAGRLRPRRPW